TDVAGSAESCRAARRRRTRSGDDRSRAVRSTVLGHTKAAESVATVAMDRKSPRTARRTPRILTARYPGAKRPPERPAVPTHSASLARAETRADVRGMARRDSTRSIARTQRAFWSAVPTVTRTKRRVA